MLNRVLDFFVADPQDIAASWSTPSEMFGAGSASSVSRCDTPLLPSRPRSAIRSRATLTLLTGMNAGFLVGVDAAGVIVGRAPDMDLVVEDPGVSRRHARVAQACRGSFYVEDLGSTNGTFVGSRRVGISLLQAGDVVQLGPELRMRFAMVDVAEESLYRQLYESSAVDPLTQLFNRRYLADRLVAEVSHAQRSGGELALLMADVDSFKRVNDRVGHLAGDRALCIIGARMKCTIRVEDVLARYGGDEFVIVAPGTSGVEALHLGERVRRAIEELHMRARGEDLGITLSVGGASLAELTSREEPIYSLLALADSRLYAAKAAGGNRVCTTGPSA